MELRHVREGDFSVKATVVRRLNMFGANMTTAEDALGEAEKAQPKCKFLDHSAI